MLHTAAMTAWLGVFAQYMHAYTYMYMYIHTQYGLLGAGVTDALQDLSLLQVRSIAS